MINTISADNLKKLQDEQAVYLVDVREANEAKISNIKGSINIPLSTLKLRNNSDFGEIDKKIVIFCHLGQRSLKAIQYLLAIGVIKSNNCFSLEGGIESYNEKYSN